MDEIDRLRAELDAKTEAFESAAERNRAYRSDLHDAREERDAALALLRDLLAVIHRDGGHYTGTHGIEKSAKDAQAVVSAERVALDAASFCCGGDDRCMGEGCECHRLRADLAEQSRLLAMSGEREAKLIAQRDMLAKALRAIAAIENMMVGSDWEEIDQARDIASAALESLK